MSITGVAQDARPRERRVHTIMVIGFSGTRRGMSTRQKLDLVTKLQELSVTEFHHGDCIGADAEAHDIVRDQFPDIQIVVHPPNDDKQRAWRRGDVILPTGYYLNRNRSIVDSTEALIATPWESRNVVRSGTWFTIRYAQEIGKPAHIIGR